MFQVLQKKSFSPLIVILALFTAGIIGCGESQGTKNLTAWLTDFTQLVEDYESSVSSDKTKQAEWDAKIDSMTAKWVDMRNEFGAELTPMQMEKMVQQYETLISKLTEFKKSIGS